MLTAAGRFAEEVLAPLNRSGDQEGARLENGQVIPAKGFKAAYKAFAEGGWHGLAADPAYGGQGLPKALEQAAFEALHGGQHGLRPLPDADAGRRSRPCTRTGPRRRRRSTCPS